MGRGRGADEQGEVPARRRGASDSAPDHALAALEADEVIRSLLATYESLCPNEDGVWNCDIGAATLAWLCDQAGIPRRLRSGIYWHPDVESYNAALGYEEGSDDWATWTDEAHCWIECDRDYGTFIIDSNPERLDPKRRRGIVPRVWLLDPRRGLIDRRHGAVWDASQGTWTDSPFEPCNDHAVDMIGYEEDEDIEELAKDGSFSRNLAEILEKARALLAAGA